MPKPVMHTLSDLLVAAAKQMATKKGGDVARTRVLVSTVRAAISTNHQDMVQHDKGDNVPEHVKEMYRSKTKLKRVT